MDDYGLAIINNKNDTTALSLFYGLSAGHGHSDCLNLEIYSHGRKITPDLGYPDFMNTFVPGIASWSKNTISHNTVVVNSRRQYTDDAYGKATGFHEGEGIHIIDVEADRSYRETSIYRRTIVQVDVNESASYFVDVFRISGGEAHDLSIHAAPGNFKTIGLELSPPETSGTLAGENVPYGYLYDDPVRSKPDYKGGFYEYSRSGYQHLFNVQRAKKGEGGILEWKLSSGAGDTFLRVHIFPEKEQEIIVTDAWVSPTRKRPDIIKYVLAQRRGKNLESCYVTIWEPFIKAPLIKNISRLPVKINPEKKEDRFKDRANEVIALSISLSDGREQVICISPFNEVLHIVDDLLETDSRFAILEKDRDGFSVKYSSAGKSLRVHNRELKTSPLVKGEIVSVDYVKRILKVKCKEDNFNPDDLIHKWIRMYNPRSLGMRQITSVKRNNGFLEIGIGRYDLMNALLLTGEIDAGRNAVEIGNSLPWKNQLIGMLVITEDMKPVSRVLSLGKTHLEIEDMKTAKDNLTDANKNGKIQIYLSKSARGMNLRLSKE